MWNSVFLVFLAIGGSSANVFRDCDMKICDVPPRTKIAMQAPNEEELKLLCSPMLERFECQKGAIEDCTGKTLEELSTSDNKTVASDSTLMLNLQSLSEDLCDEESLLHEGYVSSVDCFNEKMKVRNPKCHQEATASFQAFVESQKLLGVVRNEMEEAEDADCMTTAYEIACFTIELREECGEIARATMVEMLKRTKFVTLSLGTCKKEQMDILRSTYLESMGFEEQKKSWFSEVFNARK